MGIEFLTLRRDRERIRDLLSGFTSEKEESAPLKKGWIPHPLFILFLFAGVSSNIRDRIVGGGALLFFSALVVGLTTHTYFLLVLTGVVMAIGYAVLVRKAFKRAESFEKDYPALLLSLAASSRAGMDPGCAFANSVKLFPSSSEMARELAKFNTDLEDGFSEREAIQRFASSIHHPDVGLFKEAFLLARQEGVSLGEPLQRIARVTRQRQSFRRKAKSAVAMQKLSAFGIVGCCVVIGAFQLFSNPQGFLAALSEPLGKKLISIGIALLFVGIFWMLRIARVRI